MSDSIIHFGGQQQARDDLLIALLQYHFQQMQLQEIARTDGVALYRYLPETNLLDIVLDGLGIPPEGHRDATGVFRRDGFFDYPSLMIHEGTDEECRQVINRIRCENAVIKTRGGQFIGGTWIPPKK
jgi:hypothetical protein